MALCALPPRALRPCIPQLQCACLCRRVWVFQRPPCGPSSARLLLLKMELVSSGVYVSQLHLLRIIYFPPTDGGGLISLCPMILPSAAACEHRAQLNFTQKKPPTLVLHFYDAIGKQPPNRRQTVLYLNRGHPSFQNKNTAAVTLCSFKLRLINERLSGPKDCNRVGGDNGVAPPVHTQRAPMKMSQLFFSKQPDEPRVDKRGRRGC